MPKLSKPSLSTVISFPTKVRYYCMTPTPEGACGYMWMVDVPANGRPVSTTRACFRCGHVSAWNASTQTPPSPRTERSATAKQRNYLAVLLAARPDAEQALAEIGMRMTDLDGLTVELASDVIKRLIDDA